jgi:excisionase family DNA binding protein
VEYLAAAIRDGVIAVTTTKPPTAIIPALLSPIELMDYTRLSKDKVFRLLRDGTLPRLKIGSATRIPKAAVDKWLASLEVVS